MSRRLEISFARCGDVRCCWNRDGVYHTKPDDCRNNIVNRPARGVQSQVPRNGEPNRMHTM